MFKQDINAAVSFLIQPVNITLGSEKLMLQPTEEEVSQKCEQKGFWKSQWQMFNKECDAAIEFLTKPIEFK